MEDFFKQFRDNLEHRPEPSFEEKDWQGLQKRLDRQDEKRPAGLAWQWLVLPFLLLLASNTLFFLQIKRANQKIATLEVRNDTVFYTRTVYVTDTIYLSKVVHDKVRYPASFSAAYPGNFDRQRIFDLSGAHKIPPSYHQKIDIPSLGQYWLWKKNNEPVIQPQEEIAPENQRIATDFEKLPTLDIDFVRYRRPDALLQEMPIALGIKKQNKTLRHHLYTMRPKSFHCGITGGWAFPMDKGLDFRPGYSIGLQTGIEFLPNLRIWADAAYSKVWFETDRMGEDIGVPLVDPPSDQFVFLKAEVPQPSLQYSVGMQYLFNARHAFKPFVGVGYGAVSVLPCEIVYEFENPTLGIEWGFEKRVERNELLTDFLLIRAGFEQEFSKKWGGQIKATYRLDWEKTGFLSPRVFGIEGGLMRRF